MAKIRCNACGRGYTYEGDCCPHCGAFNRRPKREYIGADGEVHIVDDKVCFEKKVCFEEQAEKVWKDSPDRKPERRKKTAKRPRTMKTADSAERVVEGFAQKMRQSRAGGVRRGGAASRNRPGAVAIIAVVVAALGFVTNIIEDTGLFEPRQEPARPDVSIAVEAVPETVYNDYGGYFTLQGGDQLLAFLQDVELYEGGIMQVKTYCDGAPSRFRLCIVDEITGDFYDPVSVSEWQARNFLIKCQLDDHDPYGFFYSIYYLDTETTERYLLGEVFGGDTDTVPAQQIGTFREIPLLDGETLHVTSLMEHNEAGVTVVILCDRFDLPDRFIPYLQDNANGDLYDPVEIVDNGVGEYWYTFPVGMADIDREFSFCYVDTAYDAIFNVDTCQVPAAGMAAIGSTASTSGNFYVGSNLIVYEGTMEHVDGTVTVSVKLDGNFNMDIMQPYLIDHGTALNWGVEYSENPAEGEYNYLFRIRDHAAGTRLEFGFTNMYSGETYALMEIAP